MSEYFKDQFRHNLTPNHNERKGTMQYSKTRKGSDMTNHQESKSIYSTIDDRVNSTIFSATVSPINKSK
jgi:hypothetical protein